MNSKLRVLELFGGIGACTQALKKLRIPFEVVDYVEIDKYAVKSYNAMNDTNFEPQDITTWDKQLEVDLIMHGSPCQDFSIAGKQAGGDIGSGTRSSLLYETVRIVQKLTPKYVVWENVKNVLSKKHKHNFDDYLEQMERLGYKNYYQILNAKDYGIPQNRERVFTISILGEHDLYVFPQKQELKLRLKDMLEDEVDEKYYLSIKMEQYVMKNGTKGYSSKPEIDKDIASPLLATMTKMHRAGIDNYVSIKEATKKGYKEAYDGDSVNLEQPNSETRRGRVGNQVAQTLTTSCNQGVVIYDDYNSKIRNDQDTIGTITQQTGNSALRHNYKLIENNKRIRKLTPLECWRLMGFSDEVFNKSRQVNSNSQLYKQAGNSIVVNVLEAILNNLLRSDYR